MILSFCIRQSLHNETRRARTPPCPMLIDLQSGERVSQIEALQTDLVVYIFDMQPPHCAFPILTYLWFRVQG
jgi:hypothetical protein